MMTHDQITELVAAGESETLEFKRTTGELRQAIQTVCAMLNHYTPAAASAANLWTMSCPLKTRATA